MSPLGLFGSRWECPARRAPASPPLASPSGCATLPTRTNLAAVAAAGARAAAAGGSALYDAPVSEPDIRKVRPDDLEEVWRVHVAASNDLVVRRGRPAP